MNVTVEATYENGVLILAKPLQLKEHEKVKLTIQSQASPLLAAYGIMGFQGTVEEADYFALDSELDPQS